MKNHEHTDNDQFNFIRREHALFRSALNSSSAGVIITDNTQHDNPIIFCNDTFERMTGYKREEVIGHNCRLLQQGDRDQRARTEIRTALEADSSCRVRIRNYTKDGTLFHNEVHISPIWDNDGNVTHYIGIQHDITLQKKDEDMLKATSDMLNREIRNKNEILEENDEYLSSIVETIRQSIVVLSPEYKILGANQHFRKTFKVSAGETMGKSLFELGNGQWNIDELKLLLDQILPTSNPVLDYEVDHDFPYIGKKLMLLNAYQVESEGRYKDRILMAIEDITERRILELRKDDFLAIASHELKTPLTAIKGYVYIARQMLAAQPPSALSGVLDKTMNSIDRLNHLVAELLDVTRIEHGGIRLEFTLTAFDQLVEIAAADFADTFPDQKPTVSGATGCSLTIDTIHIRQVIDNLLSNSAKYSAAGSPLHIQLGRVGDFVKFSITDNGQGIKPEDQPYIFQRFFRARDIQNRYPGIGMGLYICDQIIRNHGGSLWIEESSPSGSTFSFTLPIKNR
ncbi:MAG: PAS domain-containing protein [Chitinophagaceae bacterium]|nr:MAG: PAS domain-containing protein [Chitinophagaceae bacterium]